MMRGFVNSCAFLAGFCGIIGIMLPSPAHAEIIPATLSGGGSSVPATSTSNWCSTHTNTGVYQNCGVSYMGQSTAEGECAHAGYSGLNTTTMQCYGQVGSLGSVGVYSCPDGYTLSGTTCNPPPEVYTCPAGYHLDGQSCATECQPAGTKDSHYGNVVSLSSIESPTGCASNGCSYKIDFAMCGGGSCAGTMTRSTGSACTNQAVNVLGEYGPAEGAPSGGLTPGEEQCIQQGKCPVMINGNVTCATCAAYKSTTTSTTGANSTTSTTETTDNGATVTTSTTTDDGQATETTETEQAKDDYCAANPHAAVCREYLDECKQFPDRLSCHSLGTLDDETLGTENNELGQGLTPYSLPGSSSCPADIALPKGMSFEWAGICQWASALRPIILAMAWLTAGLIVLGAARNG